jgi:hypothetical protein
MQHRRTFLLVASLLAFTAAYSGRNALASAPSFTITATNVTMSSNAASGTGSTSITLTSVNGYAGTVGIICSGPTESGASNLPICNLGGPAYVAFETLTANQTASGTVAFYNSHPPCNPCPVNLPRRAGHRLPVGLALAGALVFGFGFQRKAPRWLVLILVTVGSLAGLAGISACGGNSANNVVTPGTYTYTLSAVDMNTPPSASVTTSVTVTVP